MSAVFNILAPHPDDAALSLGVTLASLAAAGERLRIVTCFSRSAWAPNLSQRNLESVTAIRRAEDRRYAASLGSPCELVDLGGTDAPFRGGYHGRFAFIHQRPFDANELATRAWLVQRLGDVLADGPLLLPMALGGHIDHRLVLDAGLAVCGGRPLGLYEELPYAIGRGGETADAAVALVEGQTGASLRPLLVTDDGWQRVKADAMARYGSQIDAAGAQAALQHGVARGGGERVYVDEESRLRLAALTQAPRPAGQ